MTADAREPMKKCGLGEGTHHFACECREANVSALVKSARQAHRFFLGHEVGKNLIPCALCEALKNFPEEQ